MKHLGRCDEGISNSSTLCHQSWSLRNSCADKAQSCNYAPNDQEARQNTGDWTHGARRTVTDQVMVITIDWTEDARRPATDQVMVMAAVKAAHKIGKILLILNIFKTANKGAINFETDARRYRHAKSTAVQPTLDPNPNLRIAQQFVTITNGNRTVTFKHFCKMIHIKVR